MTPTALGAFALMVLTTTFIAGVFGMAGGMLLMGGLLLLVSVADAMVLHGISQLTSNSWRSVLWFKYVRWKVVLRYGFGLAAAAMLFSWLRIIPNERAVFLFLGIVPFLGRVLPDKIIPAVNQRFGAETCGFVCTALQFLSGVSGPVLDTFFIRSDLDRRSIVASKAACQTITHLAKLFYFGLLVAGATSTAMDITTIAVAISLAIIGTSLSRQVLDRMTDDSFRRYTWWIITAIGVVFLGRAVVG